MIVGYLVYHTRTGRTRFVDQIYIAPKHRRKGHAMKLLNMLTTGPIELIVRRENTRALAAYLDVGFCREAAPEGIEPDDTEFFMRTRSYIHAKKRIQAKLAARPPPKTRVTAKSAWTGLDDADQSYMLKTVMASEKLARNDALRVLTPPGASYVILKT